MSNLVAIKKMETLATLDSRKLLTLWIGHRSPFVHVISTKRLERTFLAASQVALRLPVPREPKTYIALVSFLGRLRVEAVEKTEL